MDFASLKDGTQTTYIQISLGTAMIKNWERRSKDAFPLFFCRWLAWSPGRIWPGTGWGRKAWRNSPWHRRDCLGTVDPAGPQAHQPACTVVLRRPLRGKLTPGPGWLVHSCVPEFSFLLPHNPLFACLGAFCHPVFGSL